MPPIRRGLPRAWRPGDPNPRRAPPLLRHARLCYGLVMSDDMRELNELHEELDLLRRQLERMNNHRFVRIHNSTKRLVLYQFLRGLAFGLGSAVGATILVSVAAFMLAQIDFLPIIGDWAAEIAAEIDAETYGVDADTQDLDDPE